MANKYLITSAQNATPIHEGFFDSLLLYCRMNKAELIVIPYKYRNPTNPWEHEDEYFDPMIEPYLLRERTRLSHTLQLLADVSISPTAKNPLGSFEPLSNGLHSVLAHPQIALKYIPTPQGELPLALSTTGTISLKNYNTSRSGKTGEFHHSFGALVIEIDGDIPHIRHISAHDDGSFIDLGIHYAAQSTRLSNPLGIVMGDLHIGSTCPKVTLATNRLIKEFQPETIVLHDCFDGETVNHHEEKNPFAKVNHRFKTLKDELDRNANVLKAYANVCKELVIVNSNHNDFLYRWLQRVDWKTLDTDTAKIYLENCLNVMNNSNADVYGAEMQKRGVNATFLELDESYKLEGIELGYHGHLGANGAPRGSAKTYSKLGSKTVIGHLHTPGIEKGCYIVGTSTHLKLGYTKGLSSWLNTHCLIYEGGKRQLINIIDGKYTLDYTRNIQETNKEKCLILN